MKGMKAGGWTKPCNSRMTSFHDLHSPFLLRYSAAVLNGNALFAIAVSSTLVVSCSQRPCPAPPHSIEGLTIFIVAGERFNLPSGCMMQTSSRKAREQARPRSPSNPLLDLPGFNRMLIRTLPLLIQSPLRPLFFLSLISFFFFWSSAIRLWIFNSISC